VTTTIDQWRLAVPHAPVRAAAFFLRFGAQGNIGFGEAYMAGDWESPDWPPC
jgi:hypothetical protein